MNIYGTLLKFRPARDLNPWPLRYRCSALRTELTSQLKLVRSSHIWFSYIYSHLFVPSRFIWNQHNDQLPDGIQDSLNAFNYHCLQLTWLVQRRSLQNNAYRYSPKFRYLTNVKETFISMTQLQPWLNLIALWMWGNMVPAPDLKKKKKSWAAVILIPNLRIFFNYLPFLH